MNKKRWQAISASPYAYGTTIVWRNRRTGRIRTQHLSDIRPTPEVLRSLVDSPE